MSNIATAIFSSDANELYSNFVQPVTSAWKNLGFDVLAVQVTSDDCYADPSEIPLGNQAQMIRMLLPALYPELKFITTDVDMLPLSREYFRKACDLVKSDNEIINISADAYPEQVRMPVCYFMGYGSAFSKVTGVKTRSDISDVMKAWWSKGQGWGTDELSFTEMAMMANSKGSISLKGYARGWIRGIANDRIDRAHWVYDKDLLDKGQYIDSHMLRPLQSYRANLLPLFESIGVTI
jgi:hypothetical protein